MIVEEFRRLPGRPHVKCIAHAELLEHADHPTWGTFGIVERIAKDAHAFSERTPGVPEDALLVPCDDAFHQVLDVIVDDRLDHAVLVSKVIVDELAGHVCLPGNGRDRGCPHAVTLEELAGGRGDVAARPREPARFGQAFPMMSCVRSGL